MLLLPLSFLSHHKRINVCTALWRCGVTHVLLLIINYRSASHHLKNRAVPPWKNFYFNQFSIMLSPDPAQLHTGAGPKTWVKTGSSCRETKQHIPPKTWKGRKKERKSKKETFITIRDQCHAASSLARTWVWGTAPAEHRPERGIALILPAFWRR